AMNNCTDQEYWDTLVYQCIPCSLVCSRPTVRRCAALCESMDCNRRAGSYYDELLKKCINCTTVCGQHPKQCAPSCESKAVWGGWSGDAGQDPPGLGAAAAPSTSNSPASIQRPKGSRAVGRRSCKNPTLFQMNHLPKEEPGLSWQLQQWGCFGVKHCLARTTVTQTPGNPNSFKQANAAADLTSQGGRTSLFADRLVEAGSVGDGSTGSKVPEPVETCGFCFPGHSSAVRETKPCHSSSCHIGERAAPSHTGICSTGSAGAIPSPEDGHFKIICSPSQEKTPMV
ncbi:Tumor necrosis factor receptor superfamily member 13B, partial [Tauraco erythrolophus]